MTNRSTECAAIELKNGLYRLIEVTWVNTAAEGSFDYYHAAFEQDGRWNAEFYDEAGKSIWARGTEDTLAFEWGTRQAGSAGTRSDTTKCDGIDVVVSDVAFEAVPPGALCQTVEERDNGIPRHWKKWRIV